MVVVPQLFFSRSRVSLAMWIIFTASATVSAVQFTKRVAERQRQTLGLEEKTTQRHGVMMEQQHHLEQQNIFSYVFRGDPFANYASEREDDTTEKEDHVDKNKRKKQQGEDGVDPELVKSVKLIDERIRSFIDKEEKKAKAAAREEKRKARLAKKRKRS